MAMRNTPTAYGSIQKVLHWLVALLIFGQFMSVWALAYLSKDNPLKNELFQAHVLIGLFIFFIIILRILWRSTNPRVLPPGCFNSIEITLSSSVHLFLYVATLCMPILGYLRVTAKGHDLHTFGLTIPSIMHNLNVAAIGKVGHTYLGYCLLAAIILHTIGAFAHKKAMVLKRMLA